jgi:hypothetical protein
MPHAMESTHSCPGGSHTRHDREGYKRLAIVPWTMRIECDWRSDYQRSLIACFVWVLKSAIESLKQFYDAGPVYPPYYHNYEPHTVSLAPPITVC